jgi:cytochrome c oxidase subunit 2
MTSDRVFGFQIAPIASLLGGTQSALNPQGPVASEIAALTWLLFAGATAIFLGVVALAAYALFARRGRRAWMARTEFVVAAGIVFPLVVLTGLLIRAFLPTAEGDSGAASASLRIEVVGEQWWWRVHYLNAGGGHEFATANEIRIPVGRPVELSLRSADVIHSFWVPSLAGKLDMIPGRVNRLHLSAEQAGEFRGQCAEYCGGPHARMAFFVIAQRPDEFEAWRAQQQRPATVPATQSTERGQWLFVERGCGVCHSVRGTAAQSTRGPDLTHVGSRISLGAGTLRNGAGALADWISSSQHLKPENLMPSFDTLPAAELGAIAAYLESLQ